MLEEMLKRITYLEGDIGEWIKVIEIDIKNTKKDTTITKRERAMIIAEKEGKIKAYKLTLGRINNITGNKS